MAIMDFEEDIDELTIEDKRFKVLEYLVAYNDDVENIRGFYILYINNPEFDFFVESIINYDNAYPSELGKDYLYWLYKLYVFDYNFTSKVMNEWLLENKWVRLPIKSEIIYIITKGCTELISEYSDKMNDLLILLKGLENIIKEHGRNRNFSIDITWMMNNEKIKSILTDKNITLKDRYIIGQVYEFMKAGKTDELIDLYISEYLSLKNSK